MIYDVLNSTPLPRCKVPQTALDSVPFHGTQCGWGPGGALKLPQRVRAEPGRQTYFSAFGGKKLSIWQ